MFSNSDFLNLKICFQIKCLLSCHVQKAKNNKKTKTLPNFKKKIKT